MNREPHKGGKADFWKDDQVKKYLYFQALLNENRDQNLEKLLRIIKYLNKQKCIQSPHILDIGCGSRPALDWFTDSPCHKYYLDPLLKQYMTIPEVAKFWSHKDPRYLLPIPAEKHIGKLDHKFDFIICWNVLDHTYDWRKILHNITSYCVTGGLVCIGTDFESHGVGHPGIDDKGYFMSFIKQYYSGTRTENHLHDRDLALSLVKRNIK